MENNIDYILKEVAERGYNYISHDGNDFAQLITKKDFKDLVALELYETYFWYERHEFDLQLLKEIIEQVSKFFCDPDTIMQIKSGLLQTLPSEIIIAMVCLVHKRIKNIKDKKADSVDENSSWFKIEQNIKKIDAELTTHDYILTEEIERIFGTSREEIQPLLKLCGCKCFFYKNRSIWIKPGLSEQQIWKILKTHNFKRSRKRQ